MLIKEGSCVQEKEVSRCAAALQQVEQQVAEELARVRELRLRLEAVDEELLHKDLLIKQVSVTRPLCYINSFEITFILSSSQNLFSIFAMVRCNHIYAQVVIYTQQIVPFDQLDHSYPLLFNARAANINKISALGQNTSK
jgi:hypothetical protein